MAHTIVDGDCVQTIQQPCLSVWCINTLPNDDIVVGSSDGVVRLFTKATDRYADQETLKVGVVGYASHEWNDIMLTILLL